MFSLSDSWLPIVLSCVLAFLASSVLHILLPIHRRDYEKMPGEDEVMDVMRKNAVEPGQYMFPCT
ncbi:MAG: hypothetical protein ACYTG5_23110 [Planctomycetota bacterium]|jgi:hypothetical protein